MLCSERDVPGGIFLYRSGYIGKNWEKAKKGPLTLQTFQCLVAESSAEHVNFPFREDQTDHFSTRTGEQIEGIFILKCSCKEYSMDVLDFEENKWKYIDLLREYVYLWVG
jgi:hypothetical protein